MANEGQRRPRKAHKGPQRRTRAQTTHRWRLFLNVHFIFNFSITTKPRKAHSSQRRPMKAHKDEKGPMTWTGEMGRVMAGARDASPRYVLIFFFSVLLLLLLMCF